MRLKATGVLSNDANEKLYCTINTACIFRNDVNLIYIICIFDFQNLCESMQNMFYIMMYIYIYIAFAH